jgi:hypothetical protein
MENGPIYWLLGVEAYDYDLGVLRGANLSGQVLILSRQLWSIVRGETVLSILIGPGVFKGVATSGNRRVEVLEPLLALMFDPTQMRTDEPVPLVDIISPEVIDPLATRKTEEIMTTIRQLVVERGNVLAAEPLMKVRTNVTVPTMAHSMDLLKKIHVSHVAGTQRARFILAGTNSPMYRPFVDWYRKRKYYEPQRIKIMATPFSKFTSSVDIETMSDWTVVEKAGVSMSTGIEAIREEYEQTLAGVRENESLFIYEV